METQSPIPVVLTNPFPSISQLTVWRSAVPNTRRWPAVSNGITSTISVLPYCAALLSRTDHRGFAGEQHLVNRARAEPDLLASYSACAAGTDIDIAIAGLRVGRPGGRDPRDAHFTAPRPARRAPTSHHPGIPSSWQCDPDRGGA